MWDHTKGPLVPITRLRGKNNSEIYRILFQIIELILILLLGIQTPTAPANEIPIGEYEFPVSLKLPSDPNLPASFRKDPNAKVAYRLKAYLDNSSW